MIKDHSHLKSGRIVEHVWELKTNLLALHEVLFGRKNCTRDLVFRNKVMINVIISINTKINTGPSLPWYMNPVL
jgi:hypothetical protein